MNQMDFNKHNITIHLYEKPTILNNQFQSVFSEKCNYTKQEFQNKCHMGGSYQTAPEINIACAGVLKLL